VNHSAKRSQLWKSLPIHLVKPSFRAVGRDDEQRQFLIESLGNCRRKIQHRAARRYTHSHGATKSLAKPDGYETCASLVGNRNAVHSSHAEIVCQRRISASWTDNHISYASLKHKSRKLQSVPLVAIHI
jgi:hypothetical protein